MQFVPLEYNWVSGLEVPEQSPNLCHLLPNVKPATLWVTSCRNCSWCSPAVQNDTGHTPRTRLPFGTPEPPPSRVPTSSHPQPPEGLCFLNYGPKWPQTTAPKFWTPPSRSRARTRCAPLGGNSKPSKEGPPGEVCSHAPHQAGDRAGAGAQHPPGC